jgi:hypothetical protein
MSAPETIAALQEPLTRGAVQTCVKTPARFHTNLFRSLFRGFTAFRIGKITKNFALLDRLQNLAEFSHGLGGYRTYRRRLGEDRSPCQSRRSIGNAK